MRWAPLDAEDAALPASGTVTSGNWQLTTHSRFCAPASSGAPVDHCRHGHEETREGIRRYEWCWAALCTAMCMSSMLGANMQDVTLGYIMVQLCQQVWQPHLHEVLWDGVLPAALRQRHRLLHRVDVLHRRRATVSGSESLPGISHNSLESSTRYDVHCMPSLPVWLSGSQAAAGMTRRSWRVLYRPGGDQPARSDTKPTRLHPMPFGSRSQV